MELGGTVHHLPAPLTNKTVKLIYQDGFERLAFHGGNDGLQEAEQKLKMELAVAEMGELAYRAKRNEGLLTLVSGEDIVQALSQDKDGSSRLPWADNPGLTQINADKPRVITG